MKIYIPQDANYNLKQALDIVHSCYSQQLKINLYKDSDKVYSDNPNYFPELLYFTERNSDYYNNIAIKKGWFGFYGFYKAYFLNKETANHNILELTKDFSGETRSILTSHKDDSYSGMEIANLINKIACGKGVFYNVDEEKIIASFVNHEFKDVEFDTCNPWWNVHDIMLVPQAIVESDFLA
jgi:hypothetical protein